MFVQDYILNGRAHGEGAEALAGVHFDVGLMRPYISRRGRQMVTVNASESSKGQPRYIRDLVDNGTLVTNTPATLRKDDWLALDRAVLRAARARLKAWTDLMSASSFGGFDGMAKMLLEHETMSDPGFAQVDMDAMSEGQTDSPLFQLEGLPLPITHSDFWFDQRRLAISRNSGTPLDTTMAEAAGRRVAEMIERTLIGTQSGMTYGTATRYSRSPTVYGYTNFPARITKIDMTVPTGSNCEVTVAEVLGLLTTLSDANQYGPFMLYHSTDWDKWMDSDYKVTGGNNPNQTLRDRLRRIGPLTDVRRLDFLPATTNPYTFILVMMVPEVARAVNGMALTTVQWPSMGGLRTNFKVMCIQVPQLRADYYGRTGIAHARTP